MNRERQNQISREKILAAAIDEFGQCDYSEASTNRLAQAHGLSKGLIFHYYSSKEQLFVECARQCLGDLMAYLNANFSPLERAEDSLYAYSALRDRFFQENPAYVRIFAAVVFRRVPQLQGALEPIERQWKALNARIFRKILGQIPLKEEYDLDEIVALAEELSNFVNALVARVGEGRSPVEVLEDKAARYLRLMRVMLYGAAKQ